MKFITLTAILLGMILLGIGLFEFTQSKIVLEQNLKEAMEVIKQQDAPYNHVRLISDEKKTAPTIGEIIGLLTIPAIKGELPIVEGTDEDDLEKGVGHYKGSSFPNERGQIVLSGHRDTVFRSLGELQIGDILSISLVSGTYSYKIESTEIVNSDDRSIITLQKEEEILTLTTCYPFSYVGNAPKRYIITAIPLKNAK